MTVLPAEYNITLMRNSIYSTEFTLMTSSDTAYNTTGYSVVSSIRNLDKSGLPIEVDAYFKDEGDNKNVIVWTIDTSEDGNQLLEDEYMYDVLLYAAGIKEYWIRGRIFVEDTVTTEA